MSGRAEESSVPIEPPYFPKSFLEYLKRHDPANVPYTASDTTNPFRGKKILVLSGKEDMIIPWTASTPNPQASLRSQLKKHYGVRLRSTQTSGARPRGLGACPHELR